MVLDDCAFVVKIQCAEVEIWSLIAVCTSSKCIVDVIFTTHLNNSV